MAIVRATTDVTLRHAAGRPKVASWSYIYELVMETTRIVLSEVVTPSDVAALQSGTEAECRQVKSKMKMVQNLLNTWGGVPAVAGCRTESLLVGSMPAEWIWPTQSVGRLSDDDNNDDNYYVDDKNAPATQSPKAILYFHGGGYMVCGISTHRRLMSRLAVAANTPLLAVDYRLMPEATFKDILEDAETGFTHLLDQGFRPEQIVLAGDSAGGHLCICLALVLQQKGKA
mmetsp:Transcript_18396/g.51554  ORF Transcript_18396/g.51554 Transcript_18396/m.51554 type:complete len:229 (-) Transcript_18396:895-1581(-)